MADENEQEQEQEQETASDVPPIPVEPPEGWDKRGAEDGDPVQVGPRTDAVPVENGQGESEAEIEKVTKQLEAEATRHANRISTIMGEAAQELIPCELCWPKAPGFRFAQMPEEQRSAVLTAIGFPPKPPLEKDPDADRCPTCKGRGELDTGSLVETYAAMICRRCQGRGAVGPRFDAAPPIPPQHEAPPTDGNAAPLIEDDSDEAIMMAALRAKGFTVMAPPVPTGP